MRQPFFLRDLSVSAIVAGFVAVLVSYASSAVIVFQAAEAAGASPAQIGGWLSTLGLGMGVTSLHWGCRFTIACRCLLPGQHPAQRYWRRASATIRSPRPLAFFCSRAH